MSTLSSALSASNVPASMRTTTCFGFTIKALVSKKKHRFVHDGVDLDLTYITDQIIAMGYPSQGLEAFYRNGMADVRRFLDQRHSGHFRIWNLCSEREYGAGHFPCEVERFTWADHTPPPFSLIRPACESMQSWLSHDPANVAVVHCKAGKGRTGTIIACYLLHAGACATADEALQLFGNQRTRNGRGVTIPSQARYVRYYALQLAARAAAGLPRPPPLQPAAAAAAAAASAGQRAHPAGSSSSVGEERGISSGGAAAAAAGLPLAPHRIKVGARAVVVRMEPEVGPCTGPAARIVTSASHYGLSRTVLTLALHRDWERALGFTVARSAFTLRPIVASLKDYGPDVDDGLDDPVDGPSAVNSVVPVPVRGLLRPGDELVSVNGVDVCAAMSFNEVVSLLRGALDPLTLRVAREVDADLPLTPLAHTGATHSIRQPTAGAAADAPGASRATPESYLLRVAHGVGPWAVGADPQLVPAPAVALTAVEMSHLPGATSSAGSSSSGGEAGAGAQHSGPLLDTGTRSSSGRSSVSAPPAAVRRRPAAPPSPPFSSSSSSWRCVPSSPSSSCRRRAPEDDLYLQVLGGPACTTVLFDSRGKGSAHAARAAVAAAAGADSPAGCAKQQQGAPAAHASAAAVAAIDDSGLLTAPSPSAGAAAACGGGSGGGDCDPSSPTSAASTASASATLPAHPPAVRWDCAYLGPSGVAVAGDFRLVVRIPRRKKPVAAAWLSTACLPLPHACQGAVAAVLEAEGATTKFGLGAEEDAEAGEGEGAGEGVRGTPVHADSTAGGTSSGHHATSSPGGLHVHIPTPSARAVPALAASAEGPASPRTSRGSTRERATPARQPSGAPLQTRTLADEDAAEAPLEPACGAFLTGPILTGDVPGGRLSATAPLLGACYTAAPSRLSAAKVAGAETSSHGGSHTPAALGAVTFTKAQLDFLVKDRKHSLLPADFTLTLRYAALGLPPVYAEACRLPQL